MSYPIRQASFLSVRPPFFGIVVVFSCRATPKVQGICYTKVNLASTVTFVMTHIVSQGAAVLE